MGGFHYAFFASAVLGIIGIFVAYRVRNTVPSSMTPAEIEPLETIQSRLGPQ